MIGGSGGRGPTVTLPGPLARGSGSRQGGQGDPSGMRSGAELRRGPPAPSLNLSCPDVVTPGHGVPDAHPLLHEIR